MNEFKTILAAIDFSKNSDYAFDHAVTIAKRFDSRLVVLHVIDNSFEMFDMSGYYMPNASLELYLNEFEESAKGVMARFCETRLAGFTNYTASIVTGTPYREIIREAEKTTASLIVLGTHGRRGLERLVFGSTAERVVRGAACPVLTIPLS